MKISKKMAFAVSFAKVSQLSGIPPHELANLLTHASINAKAFASEHVSITSEAARKRGEKARRKVEEIAGRFGCTVVWDSFWPKLHSKKHADIHLPG